MIIKNTYTPAFESLWKTHSYGNKKLAFDQTVKMKFEPADYKMVIDYLLKRWLDDDDWLSGKVHHLRTILSQRHWETNNYRRRKVHAAHRDFKPEPRRPPPTDAERAKAQALLIQLQRELH